MNLFGFHHKQTPPPSAPPSTNTLFRVRQIMARILRRGVDKVLPTDSFATLTGAATVDPEACELDDNLLDLCALENAICEEFHLDVSEEENEKLFRPGTTAEMFADYIDHHHKR